MERSWMKEIRNQKGWSQEKFAHLCDCSVKTVRFVEKGMRDPEPFTAKKMAKPLGVPFEKFYENVGSEQSA